MSTAQNFIETFTDIHPLPHIVTTVTRLINDPDSTMKDFEEVIKIDPVLVSRLLRLVNSPYYGLVQSVDSIGRAVAFLGMKNLHNLVVTDAIKSFFTDHEDPSLFSKKKLWIHCAAISICSKMVAERIFGINGDDAFLCGILHDFGLLVEEQVRQNDFHRICSISKSTSSLLDMERQTFETDHCELCYLMTLDWNMPVTIQNAIRDHHLISENIKPSSLTGIIQISEYIASQQGHSTLPDMELNISPPLFQHLKDNLDEYTVLIEDLPDEMAKAQAIYG
ncbi:MAG: HDOD domain-containing protein [Desulforhopalus sp.]